VGTESRRAALRHHLEDSAQGIAFFHACAIDALDHLLFGGLVGASHRRIVVNSLDPFHPTS